MKWIVIIGFLVLGCGWFSFLAKDRRAVYVTGLLVGFLPFVLGPWHLLVAPYSNPMWVGYVKGWEISLIDVLALSVLMTRRLNAGPTPLKWPLIFYAVAVCVTVPLAKYPMFAVAYPIQLARMLLVFFAVARLAASEDGARGVFNGLVAGLTFQFFFAVAAKMHGAIQTGGTLGHQNLLGFVTHLVLLPSFAVLMGGRWRRWAMVGSIVGVAVIIMTASRATIVIAGIGIVITYVAVASTNWTSRKAAFGMITLLLLVVAIPFAQQSLNRRFAAQGGGALFGEDSEREAFEKVAGMMSSDHPMGVGPNHYVYFANLGGYNNKANVGWAQGSRTANVHNAYLLAQAETGYLGLISLWTLLGATIISCFAAAKKYKRAAYSELLTGIGCAVLCIALHNKFEWIFVTYQAQYVLFIAIGLAAGCIIQSRRRRVRKQRMEADAEEPELSFGPQEQAGHGAAG